MDTNLEIFKNEEFGSVRILVIDGNPWFVGKDVAISLGYSEPRSAVSKKVDKEDRGVAKMETPSGVQEMTIINESGLYALIFGSKLESAKRFKRWVTSEVLPAIRKTGVYSIEGKVSVPPERLQHEQKLTTFEKNALVFNRGIVLGVFRYEMEEDSALEIFERLSSRGKGMVMKMIFGEVSHA